MIDADLSATVTTATDKVIYIDDPQPWLVMIELQANWDGDLPYDLLRRYALLKHRHRLPVSVAVVLMRPDANSSAMTGDFPQDNPLGLNWGFPFTVFRVWEKPVETFLNGPLGLVPFAPLADVKTDDLPMILTAVKARIDRDASRSDGEFLRETTFQLLALRYDKVFIHKMREFMTKLDLSQNSWVQAIRQEGAVEEAREGILALGEEKFGSIPDSIRSSLERIDDLGRLHLVRKRLIRAKSWQELLSE